MDVTKTKPDGPVMTWINCAAETNKTAEVIGVGPGHVIAGGNFVPTQLHIGDIVILPTMGFTKFEYEGVSYFIGKENEVLAKINK